MTSDIIYEDLKLINAPFKELYIAALASNIDRGWFVMGDQLAMFEKLYASFCHSTHCVGVGSGLDALTFSLKAFRFKKNSEVIVCAHTYVATIFSILHAGLKPILVEPDIHTYTVDWTKIEEKITSNTVAIVAVHLYGKCCEMDKINELASIYRLKVIEDAAQSQGATFKGRISGSLGHVAAHSFYPTKILGALGDGGAITTPDGDLAQEILKLRNYGSIQKYDHELLGYNSRLDEIQAGFLSVKLQHIDRLLKSRMLMAEYFRSHLSPDFILPIESTASTDVYHVFCVRHEQRDQQRAVLASMNIATAIHYPIPVHHQKALKPYFRDCSLPITEKISQTCLSLFKYFDPSLINK